MNLVLCKNVTIDLTPIDIKNTFTPADSIIVCVAILDFINKVSIIDIVWTYNNVKVLHESKKVTPDPLQKRHRLATFLKMAYIESEKMYSQWTVSLYIKG